MKKPQWWLHETADKITIFALPRFRGGIAAELAFRLANLIDRLALRVGGNTRRGVVAKTEHETIVERLEKERKYWMEVAAGYAQELSGYTNDYRHPIEINGVELDALEQAVKEGYQTSAATQLDMISLVRRVMTHNTP